jgi:hypothetical protein
VNVYMHVVYQEKTNYWNTLSDLRNLDLWERSILVGDFNTTLSQRGKSGGSIFQDPSREMMEDLISLLDLVDVNPIKGKYT